MCVCLVVLFCAIEPKTLAPVRVDTEKQLLSRLETRWELVYYLSVINLFSFGKNRFFISFKLVFNQLETGYKLVFYYPLETSLISG